MACQPLVARVFILGVMWCETGLSLSRRTRPSASSASGACRRCHREIERLRHEGELARRHPNTRSERAEKHSLMDCVIELLYGMNRHCAGSLGRKSDSAYQLTVDGEEAGDRPRK